jgi:hypothetical protein
MTGRHQLIFGCTPTNVPETDQAEDHRRRSDSRRSLSMIFAGGINSPKQKPPSADWGGLCHLEFTNVKIFHNRPQRLAAF